LKAPTQFVFYLLKELAIPRRDAYSTFLFPYVKYFLHYVPKKVISHEKIIQANTSEKCLR
ncbi:hypothetical protein, partial [Legionella londiniensis]|uniref:hypothetical protein n=1 Tax=Legionella londiniensis TaxID=45068 RepID=UPI001A94EFAB